MRTIISSGILVSGILLIRKAARGKISRRLQYAMWITLPILMLLIPVVSFDVAFPLNAFNRSNISSSDLKKKPDMKDRYKIYGEGTSFADLTIASGIPVYNRTKIKTGYLERIDIPYPNAYFLGLWNKVRHTVTAIFIVFIFVKNIIFGIRLLKSRTFYKKDSETGMNVYTVSDKSAPFLFIKDIYLNEDNFINDKYARYMIIHEYCHFKQGDMIWNVLKYAFLAAYWYDPFIWISLYFINNDCELACDEAVVKLIGDENKEDYGMSLITLLGSRQKKSQFSIETSMRGRKSFIKERISMLSGSNKKSKTSAVVACSLVFLLAGCSLIQPHEKSIGIKNGSGKNSAYAIKTITAENADNSYYNTIKKDKDTFYFSINGGLYKFNEKAFNGEMISEGYYFLLGNISDGYLYFLKDPDGAMNPGIGRIELETGKEEILLPWADNELWFCNNVFGKEDKVYVEISGQCRAYLIKDGKAVRLDKSENDFYNAVNQFDLSDEEAFVINYGYINSIDNYSKFTLSNFDKKELFICDTDTLNVTKKEGYLGNIIICDKGVVYTKTNGDIMVCPLDEPDNEKQLFSVNDAGYAVDVRAFSENGLYALKRNGYGYECLRINWDGSINKTSETYNELLNADSGLSAFNDCIAYLKDETLVMNFGALENGNAKDEPYWVKVRPDEQRLDVEMSGLSPMRKYYPDGKTTIYPPKSEEITYYFDDVSGVAEQNGAGVAEQNGAGTAEQNLANTSEQNIPSDSKDYKPDEIIYLPAETITTEPSDSQNINEVTAHYYSGE